jgi:hypothetical protein
MKNWYTEEFLSKVLIALLIGSVILGIIFDTEY